MGDLPYWVNLMARRNSHATTLHPPLIGRPAHWTAQAEPKMSVVVGHDAEEIAVARTAATARAAEAESMVMKAAVAEEHADVVLGIAAAASNDWFKRPVVFHRTQVANFQTACPNG